MFLDIFREDLEVPHVQAVAAAVGDHVADLPAELRRVDRGAVANAATVDAGDGVGNRHPPRLAQRFERWLEHLA